MPSIRRPRADGASALALGVAIASGAVGCGTDLAAPKGNPSETTEVRAPKRGGTLRMASFGDVRTLDPAVSPEALSLEVIGLVYAGLVDYDADGRLVPDLAARWEASDDGLGFRFFLREGVRFHDGDEVDADDVVRSVERALHPTTPSPWSSFFASIDGFEDFTAHDAPHLRGVTAEGRYVVRFRLAKRDATFLRVLALPALRPVCASGGTRYEDTFAPCGAGPFRLSPGGWERGQRITLTRHDAYHVPGLPHLDAVQWSYGVNLLTQRFKFEAGDQDVLRDLTQPDLVRFRTDPRWSGLGAFDVERTVNGESMNVEIPPFDSVHVRRAVASAVDREHFRLLKPGAIRPAHQTLPEGVAEHDPAFVGQTTDLAAALAHMERAGLAFDPKTGKGGWPHPIPYYVYPQSFPFASAQVLAQDLARIGIRLDIRVVSYPAYLAITHRRRAVAISPQGWTQDFPDASDFFDSMFASRAIHDEDTNNTSFYANPKLDALLDDARGELDETKRRAAYAEANRIVCDDAPWAFTHGYRFYEVHQPYVRNWTVHRVWSHDPTRAFLDRDPAKTALLRLRSFFGGTAR